MRISDWSSDVCSSDLPDPRPAPACPAVVIRTAIRRGSSRRAPPPSLPSRPTAHHQLSSTHPEPAFGGAPFDPPTSHMPAPTGQLISALHCERLPDRKSVVKGKSVSVRVDLGGRRIIKNKKN